MFTKGKDGALWEPVAGRTGPNFQGRKGHMGVIHAKQRRESIPGRERSRAWRKGWQELRLDLKQA